MRKNVRKEIVRRVEKLEKARFMDLRVPKYLVRKLANPDLDETDLRNKLGFGDFLPREARDFCLELQYDKMRKQKAAKFTAPASAHNRNRSGKS